MLSVWIMASLMVLTTPSQLSDMGNTDRIVVSTTKLTKYTHGDFFFQGWAHRVSLQKLQNFLKIEIRMCLIYFRLNLWLKLFDRLICFCFFSPCFQCGRGFLVAWKEMTELFFLQLDLVPRNSLFHNHLGEKSSLQCFCLLSRAVITAESL